MTLHAAFDIGIKNLACCIIDTTQWKCFKRGESEDPGILFWENLNLMGEPEKCCQPIKSGKKRGEPCGKAASWTNGTNYYCGTHKGGEGLKLYRPPQIKNVNMNHLKKRAFEELDKLEIFKQVSHIVLESQPKINQKMKMFYASIEAYFIIRYQIDREILKCVKASPAKNKLKLYKGPEIDCSHLKKSYDRRKYLAEKQTEHFLEKCPEMLDKFLNHKKRDDLADAFLHCLCSFKSI